MRIEVRTNKKSPTKDEALVFALKLLKRKMGPELKLLRDRNKGYIKPSEIRHRKNREKLHLRKRKRRK